MASLHELGSSAAAAPSLVLVDGLDSYLHGMDGVGRAGAGGPQREEMSATAHLAALLMTHPPSLHASLRKQGTVDVLLRVLRSNAASSSPTTLTGKP